MSEAERSTILLNEVQIALLGWIKDGCPDGDAAVLDRFELLRAERGGDEDELGHDDRDPLGCGRDVPHAKDAETAIGEGLGAEHGEVLGNPYEDGRRGGDPLDGLAPHAIFIDCGALGRQR